MTASQQPNYRHWRQSLSADGHLTLTIDVADASANSLSAAVMRELHAIISSLPKDLKGLIFESGKTDTFIMGADIKEFTTIFSADEAFEQVRQGQQIFDAIEALKIPSVALINGFALGGGLELALACDYRVCVATDKRILGLPEVQLGIHPGFGGTVRAIRLIGARAAMPMMLTGKAEKPRRALALGLIDAVSDNLDAARTRALALLNSKPARKKASLLDRLLNAAPLRALLAKTMRSQVARKARPEHYPAPYAIIDLWRKHGARGKRAYVAEARSIANLMVGDTSRSLVRVFFLQNGLKDQGGESAHPLKHIHVVGAGVMGGDIAAWCAYRGLTVTLQDREEKYVTPAIERARVFYEKRIKNKEKLAETVDRLQSDVNGDGVAKADLIIEAIYENAEAKKSLYAALETKMKPGALLATNTSSIRLEELRQDLKEPLRFMGLHFFNPVAQLPLVEIIKSNDTQREALDAGHAFVKKIAKTPLECLSSPGFVVNRILAPYMGEAMHLGQEGIALPLIDKAAVRFGMPMGPVELADTVGLDVALHVSKILAAAYGTSVSPELEAMVEAGTVGRKSGQGFYTWENGKAQKPTAASDKEPDDLEDRLILPMVNEAVACLAEGVVGAEDQLDAGIIFGTGFAPFRGGPLHYARNRGLSEVRNRLESLAARYGDRFAPKDGWDQLLAESTSNQPIIVQK